MKTQKIIIVRKKGKYTIKGNGDHYLFQLAKGAYERGEMQPTCPMKIKRFLRRLWLTYLHRIDLMCDTIVGSPAAADCEFIGIEDGSNKKAPSEAATSRRRR